VIVNKSCNVFTDISESEKYQVLSKLLQRISSCYLRVYGQTDRYGETEMCHFESHHTENATSYCSCYKSPGRPRKLQHNLSDHWPFRSKVQGAVKQQNLITVHIFTVHPVFISSLIGHKTNKQTVAVIVCQSISYHYNTINSHRSIFCSILLSQWRWWNITSRSFPTQTLRRENNFSSKGCDKFVFIFM
jgi:hypothetical protein